MIRICI